MISSTVSIDSWCGIHEKIIMITLMNDVGENRNYVFITMLHRRILLIVSKVPYRLQDNAITKCC